MNRARTVVTLFLTLAVATAAHASWYDDYDAGIAAARAGNWNAVVAKMSAAIKGNPKEGNKTRTYGAIFINYHPYYYRGVGYLNTGKYQQAIDDLERTSGPGPENLGSIGELLDRAKRQLASAGVPDPEPVRPVVEPVRPTPATPSAPAIDPALRDRARSALAGANRRLQQAQQRRAGSSPQYQQAASLFNDASGRIAAVKSNDDLNTIITMAENAGDLADLATAPNTSTPPPAIVSNTPAAPVPTKPAVAADSVLESYKPRLRRALENYFAGEFDAATRDFEALTRELPTNGWIWAFLGASQYSQYAFEAEESYRAAAVRSFKKAKSLRRWSGGLPDKYFSKRIRRAFNEVG